jgi:tetratricopeptide (TPR) repeat protein
VILARIDRLDEDIKAVLKLAAVIGRSFLRLILESVADAGQELDRFLAELQALEFIRERRRIPELEYIFKHALVQEAAYDTILLDRRRRLHHRVAESLEALFADRLEEFASVLAYHYSRAEVWERAQAYLLKAGDQAGRIAADAEAVAYYRQALDAYARAFGDRWDPVERATLERKLGEALFRRGDHDRALDHLHRALGLLGASDPTSRWRIRAAIAGEVVRQVAHRLLPRLFVAPEAPVPAAVSEEVRIYEIRFWINYFIDPERVVLDSLRLLNVSERTGHARGVAEGLGGVGWICGAIPLKRLAGRYHAQGAVKAERLGDSQALGIAQLGLGYHAHMCRGDSGRALEHLGRAAATLRGIGELRGWGGATALMGVVLRHRGDLARSLAEGDELVRIGQDGGDRQLQGWGALVRGAALLSAGDLDDAVASLQDAAALFESIPAYGVLVEALGYLGQCHVRRGRVGDGLTVLDKSDALIARHRLRDHQVTSTWVARAQACILRAEGAQPAARGEALAEAARACHRILRLTRLVHPLLPTAYGLRGTLEWLGGRSGAAEKWWRRSISAAQVMGHRHDLGQAYLEIGRRTGRQDDLEQAATIFAEIGARLDLAEARALLGRPA